VEKVRGRSNERCVQLAHDGGRVLVVGAHDNERGRLEVADRRALPQELRVAAHVDVVAPNALS